MIEAAAGGSPTDREQFAKTYLPVVTAYLKARWRQTPYRESIDDAVQEVFLECFRDGGPLARADRRCDGGFRPFLYGVVRNVARRFEARHPVRQQKHQSGVELEVIAGEDDQHSQVFDRAWAKSMMKQAAQRQAVRAQKLGEPAKRRIELLRLRFQEGRPIREIAQEWGIDPAKLHHEYATARREFKMALVEVVAFHQPRSQEEVQRECTSLLEMLS